MFYKQMLKDFGVIQTVFYKEEYCTFYSPEDIPELSNEFFNFIHEERVAQKFDVEEEELLEEFMNFNSWLFAENLISCKIFKVKE